MIGGLYLFWFVVFPDCFDSWVLWHAVVLGCLCLGLCAMALGLAVGCFFQDCLFVSVYRLCWLALAWVGC